jgi:PTS system beta-glucosides-specific IIC component
MSYIEKFVKKITPGMIKVFAEPMLIMLITAPLTFIVLGPIANLISMGIAAVSMFLYEHAGFIAIPLLAAAYPWLVSIGIHKALSPISIQLVATQRIRSNHPGGRTLLEHVPSCSFISSWIKN